MDGQPNKVNCSCSALEKWKDKNTTSSLLLYQVLLVVLKTPINCLISNLCQKWAKVSNLPTSSALTAAGKRHGSIHPQNQMSKSIFSFWCGEITIKKGKKQLISSCTVLHLGQSCSPLSPPQHDHRPESKRRLAALQEQATMWAASLMCEKRAQTLKAK